MAKLTGLESVAKAGGKRFSIDPRLIKVRSSWNFRDFNDPENSQHIESLYLSIKEKGVLEDLTVTFDKGTVWLDDGECRLRAALLIIERDKLDIKVPVKSEDRYASDADRLINQRIRNSSKGFSVFEDAKLFKHLLDVFKLSQDEIARKCNITPGRVSQILEYNRVGKVGVELVQKGQASASLVMEVTKNEGTGAEKALLEGMKAAKANGHTKIKPGDVKGAKINVATVLRDAFEYADVDDSDEKMCVIKMPMEHWDKLKEAAKL